MPDPKESFPPAKRQLVCVHDCKCSLPVQQFGGGGHGGGAGPGGCGRGAHAGLFLLSRVKSLPALFLLNHK